MYIAELKLWNFRKYGSGSNGFDIETADLEVPFQKGMNILIGENDSGKSAIIDALKLVLKTHAYEWIKVERSDFAKDSQKLRIEVHFKGISNDEAKHFIEWLGWELENGLSRPKLILIYQAELREDKIIPSDVKAGMDGTGYILNAEAREYLKTTYLKALRDADSELMAKKNSRLSQILQEHKLFKKEKGRKHDLEEIFDDANALIKDYFNNDEKATGQKSNKDQIVKPINKFLKNFIDERHFSKFDITEAEIKSILEKISLGIDEHTNLGLGTMNRLFMAAELLHLKKENYEGLKLCLIEELEAHLHPQAQMKIIQTLDREAESDIQFILSTHSPNIASKVDLKSLIICKNSNVFPLGEEYTFLGSEIKEGKYANSYEFLKRFLDVTKSNLFFARGVILVEGWSEEILIPEIASKMNCDLTKNEVSIVNVGSTAYLHFSKIFLRADDDELGVPVSVITDLDQREYEREPKLGTDDKPIKIGKNIQYEFIKQKIDDIETIRSEKKKAVLDKNSDFVIPFVSPFWTFEWCILRSELLGSLFKEVLKNVHSDTFTSCSSEMEWEIGLAKLLLSKSLQKTQLAYELSEEIKKMQTISFKKDDSFYYIAAAIKHACKNGN
ncbi:putative ATP-dependent endonuclease of OLD family [Flavobacterium sp. 270]|uniref:ATP-dependent nuclease n=1 Tax=Flavobacterium sp. 270 TaxID=2512114 RepID=UPI0010660B2B|nr:AAA family ATPase [Flavobacterium sp. 270]TDW52077.1 putative ATP-dependent endonuclease of OLD family [Flavobacterium sp. 270]